MGGGMQFKGPVGVQHWTYCVPKLLLMINELLTCCYIKRQRDVLYPARSLNFVSNVSAHRVFIISGKPEALPIIS